MTQETLALLIKTIITNFCVYYLIWNIIESKNKNIFIKVIVFNIFISLIYALFREIVNNMIIFSIMYILFAMIISKWHNSKLGRTFILMLIAYAIANVALMLGTMIGFVPYKYLFNDDMILGTLSSSIFQLIFIWIFLKNNRIRKRI